MSRIAGRFEALRAAGRTGLVPYVMAGDPSPQATVPLMHALARAGADIIELGVPFSDPMADGPVIQRAAERAVARGVGLPQCLEYVARFRRDDDSTPVVLMGYANPIECMGIEAFVGAASESGVDGVLVVDYPPEECVDFARRLKADHIDPIFLLAPTSTERRIEQVAAAASGYVYYVSLTGTTGSANLDVAAVAGRIPGIRAKAGLPVGVGFGIKDAAGACAIARSADAVVIGSRVILAMEQGQGGSHVEAAAAFVSEIRKALDAAPDTWAASKRGRTT